MAKVQYNLSLKTEFETSIGEFQDVEFGRETKELSLLENYKSKIHLFNQGFFGDLLIEDHQVKLPGLEGHITLADLMLVDGVGKVMGSTHFTEASGYQPENVICFSLNRKHEISIEKIYEVHPKGGALLIDGQNFIETHNNILGSSKHWNETELFQMATDFDAFVTANTIDTEVFFDGMEWQSWQDLNFNRDNPTQISFLHIQSTYFPLYKQVTVLVFKEDGSWEQAQVKELDQYNGIIKIDLREHFDQNSLGTFSGIRLFYGISPAIISSYKSLSEALISQVPEDNLLAPEPKIVVSAVTSSHIDPVYVDKNQLYIKTAAWDKTDSDNLKIYNTQDDYNIFLESDSFVLANDQLLNPGIKNYLKLNELEYKEIQFKPASTLFKLDYILEPVEFFNQTNEIYVPKEVASEVVALFGKFGDRYALLAWSWPEADVVRGYSSLGFSQGPYSGASDQKAYGTNIKYVGQQQSPGSYYTNIMFDINTMYVKPKRGDSLEVVLPTWAVPGTIQVKEITAQATQVTFTDWEYHEPDIVVLDKNKVNYNKSYVIIYKQFNLPFIDEIDISTGGFKTIIHQDYRFPFQANLTNPYQGFDGLYLLSNKNINIDVGYIHKNDLTKYYINNARIKISQLVDKKFLDHFTANKVY